MFPDLIAEAIKVRLFLHEAQHCVPFLLIPSKQAPDHCLGK